MIYFLIIVGSIIVGLLLIILGCHALGLVFKDEFLYHHDQWISDGKPTIGFWRPPHGSCATFKSLWASGKYQIKWLFSTPSWIRNNKKTFYKLWIYRIVTPIGLVLFTAVLVFLKIFL